MQNFNVACCLLEERRLLHTCFPWYNDIINQILGNTFSLLKSLAVKAGLDLADIRHSSMSETCFTSDLSQESMLTIPYAVLFQLQARTSQQQLCVIWPFYAEKKEFQISAA